MRVLAISAHPDDETLGCGGTLLAHAAAGDELHWLIMTRPVEPRWSKEFIARETKEVESVAKALGVSKYIWSDLPSTSLDLHPLDDLIRRLREVIEQVKPEIVYSVHHGDVHSDHRRLFDAVGAVLKAFYMRQLGVRRWLTFECLSSTDAAPPLVESAFIPTVYRDITPFLEKKIAVMNLFGSQLQDKLMPRSAEAIRALARFRGATIGVEYAEAFSLIRELV